MAGGSLNHAQIAVNICSELRNGLKGKPCKALNSDLKIEIEEENSYFYPDVVVICGKMNPQQRKQGITDSPVLIVEVLSPSTEQKDLGIKFDAYKTLNSLQEYILVNQDCAKVSCYLRNAENNWFLTVYENLNEIVKFQSINVEIPMSEIYYEIDFTENEEDEKTLFTQELFKRKNK